MNPQQDQSNDNFKNTNTAPQTDGYQADTPADNPTQYTAPGVSAEQEIAPVPDAQPEPQASQFGEPMEVTSPSEPTSVEQSNPAQAPLASESQQTKTPQFTHQPNQYATEPSSTDGNVGSTFAASETNTVETPAVAPAPTPSSQPTAGNGLAIASLVLGIIAVLPPAPFLPIFNLLNILLGVLAIVFGIIHLRKLSKGQVVSGKGMAISGLVTGAIAVLISVAITALAVTALSSVSESASSVEVEQYGVVDSDAVSDNINTGSTTKSEADSFLGGNPECESKGESSVTCTYVGGNLEKGLVVVLDFEDNTVSGLSSSFSSFKFE